MGKFLESIGVIDGYDIIAIGKLKAKNDNIFEEIEKYDSDIKEKTREIVNESSGRVFAIVKKGIIKGLYLFEVETKNDDKNLKHIKTVYTDEVEQDTREKYDNHILNLAKEYVSMLEYDKVTLDDNVVQIDPKIPKKERILTAASGFVTGLVLGWITWDDLFMGIAFGIIFTSVFSGLDVVIRKKRGRKKKNNK